MNSQRKVFKPHVEARVSFLSQRGLECGGNSEAERRVKPLEIGFVADSDNGNAERSTRRTQITTLFNNL